MVELNCLVERSREGDLEAFTEVVRRFQDMAHGYAYSILGDFHLAEDAAQEAFVDAYYKLDALREPAAFPGWFRRIVFKHCDRAIQKKSVSTVPLEEGMRVAEPNPERSELQERVLEAIRDLPERQREATTLYYINGYSQNEISDFLEVPVTTVKKRLHDSRKKLKERMLGMVEETLKDHTLDDAFSERVAKAIQVYTAKGPAENSTGSETDMAMKAQTEELLESGEKGFLIAEALSRSDNAKVRGFMAIYFGLKGDSRCRPHLARLLHDKAASVRSRALRFYADLLHPGAVHNCLIEPASEEVPDDIEHFIPLLDDDNLKNRCYAVHAIGVYASHGDPRVDAAMAKALADPHHKVQHAAALRLRIACPGCGIVPERGPNNK